MNAGLKEFFRDLVVSGGWGGVLTAWTLSRRSVVGRKLFKLPCLVFFGGIEVRNSRQLTFCELAVNSGVLFTEVPDPDNAYFEFLCH